MAILYPPCRIFNNINRYKLLIFLAIGCLCCGCAVKGWLTIPTNKNARQYTRENLSTNTNIYISLDVGASVINTGSYVSNATDSVDITLGIDVLKAQKHIIPQLTIDEFTLVDTDKNDTLEIAYIRFHYKDKLNSFSDIMPAFKAWGERDSIKMAKVGIEKYEHYIRSYDLDFRMNRKQQEVKNLLLNLRFRVNDEQYEILNCKYRVKEGRTWIFPH